MRKRSSLSEKKKGPLDLKTEEAWLLLKLGKTGEARNIAVPLLEEHPGNTDLIELGAVIYLEQGDTKKARQLIDQLRDARGKEKVVRELMGNLHLTEKEYDRAHTIYSGLLSDYPENWDYKTSCANALAGMRNWPLAKEAYTELMSNELKREDPDIIWGYRDALMEGSMRAHGRFDYFHGPQSLRRHIIMEDFRGWILPTVRGTIGTSQEFYKQPTEGIKKAILTHSLKAEWYINDMLSVSGKWLSSYMSGHDYQELDFRAEFQKGNFSSRFGYVLNHLVRDPIEGLRNEGRFDSIDVDGVFTLFNDRVIVGSLFDVEWFKVNRDKNIYTWQKHLGYNIISDSFIDFVYWEKPRLSFNFQFREAHWIRAFKEANQVLPFFPAERVFQGGFYGEFRVGTLGEISGSVSRRYDGARAVYSTVTTAQASCWLADNIRASFFFEYQYGDAGTAGAGNAQTFTAELEMSF